MLRLTKLVAGCDWTVKMWTAEGILLPVPTYYGEGGALRRTITQSPRSEVGRVRDIIYPPVHFHRDSPQQDRSLLRN